MANHIKLPNHANINIHRNCRKHVSPRAPMIVADMKALLQRWRPTICPTDQLLECMRALAGIPGLEGVGPGRLGKRLFVSSIPVGFLDGPLDTSPSQSDACKRLSFQPSTPPVPQNRKGKTTISSVGLSFCDFCYGFLILVGLKIDLLSF
jgi:hypothetical protein